MLESSVMSEDLSEKESDLLIQSATDYVRFEGLTIQEECLNTGNCSNVSTIYPPFNFINL